MDTSGSCLNVLVPATAADKCCCKRVSRICAAVDGGKVEPTSSLPQQPKIGLLGLTGSASVGGRSVAVP